MNDELTAVRALATEPSDESVTRAWYRITQLEAKRHKLSRRRFLIPVAAGLALTTLAGGTAYYLTTRDPHGGVYLSGTPLKLEQALELLALAAEKTEPVTTLDGKLVYTETTGWGVSFTNGVAGEMKYDRHEAWYDLYGGLPMKIARNGSDLTSGPKSENHAAQIAERRAAIEREGAGMRSPTLDWLAGLPSEPGALLAEIRRLMGTHESWSVDQQLWDAMGGIYSTHEIALTPQQRAAFLRAFKGMDRLKAREITLDGRTLIAIRIEEHDSGDEILFDPATGRAVGRSSLHFGELNLAAPSASSSNPPIPALDPAVTYVGTWTQQLVDPL